MFNASSAMCLEVCSSMCDVCSYLCLMCVLICV